jgi:hypothetical protein
MKKKLKLNGTYTSNATGKKIYPILRNLMPLEDLRDGQILMCGEIKHIYAIFKPFFKLRNY